MTTGRPYSAYVYQVTINRVVHVASFWKSMDCCILHAASTTSLQHHAPHMPEQLNVYQLNKSVGTNCCTACICLQYIFLITGKLHIDRESFMWCLHAEPLALLPLFNLEALHIWRSLQYMPVELSLLHSQLHAEQTQGRLLSS